MDCKHYPSKIDWWVILILGLSMSFFIVALLLVGVKWQIVLIIALPLAGIAALGCTSTYYVIKDNELGVKSKSVWLWYPIESIKCVRKTRSIVAAPAMSFKRIAIKFERGTTRNSLPLEISPNDRDMFIRDLLKINPDIKVLQ